MSKKRKSFATGAKGTTGYLKNKKKTLRELDEMLGEDNSIDNKQHEMDRANEESKGITDRIRDIFN